MFLTLFLLGDMGVAHAYIGPGAGFAFLSSFFIFFITFLLCIFFILSWPFRIILRSLLKRKSGSVNSQVKRVVVLGLDGMEPKLVEKYMQKGKLPNLQRLKEEGSFSRLSTSYPPISPVAWSSFMTGTDPSYHNIFDFFTRDPHTYLPVLSSAEIGKATRILRIGKYKIPFGKPKIKLLRKSKPFWKVLGENGIFSSVIRVPITFPPEKFNGVLLSGMCTPDLRGSQGTFCFYTTNKDYKNVDIGGERHHVTLNSDNTIQGHLYGPENDLVRDGEVLKVPFEIVINKEKNKAVVEICNQRVELGPGAYSPWLKVIFRPGLRMKLFGICRFYINRITPDFELYVTPINIDPEKPALPISHPFIYSVYLAKLNGLYGTLGLAEDTWALNEGVINGGSFLDQAYLLYDEREKMFFKALERTPNGLCVCVFDTPDRIQHMFFRCLDKDHPANKGKETDKYKDVIEDLYVRMDKLVGRVLEKIDEKSVLIVMSDHGFTQFKRGVNLNTWFYKNGYLSLKEGKTLSGDWFKDVDWEKTKVFSLGLASIFINKKGRESQGIVAEGEEIKKLKQELIMKLTGLVDDGTGKKSIHEVVDVERRFSGPYVCDAPDLLVGYNAGYRSSWGCATGRITECVFEDNTKHWSGDHCVAPQHVPGILFVNKKIKSKRPDIKDIAPTILKLFGVEIPSYIKGGPLCDDEATSKTTLEQRGEEQGIEEGQEAIVK